MSHKKSYKKSESDVLLKCQNVCRVASALFAFLWSIQHWIAVSEYPLDFSCQGFYMKAIPRIMWIYSMENFSYFLYFLTVCFHTSRKRARSEQNFVVGSLAVVFSCLASREQLQYFLFDRKNSGEKVPIK